MSEQTVERPKDEVLERLAVIATRELNRKAFSALFEHVNFSNASRHIEDVLDVKPLGKDLFRANGAELNGVIAAHVYDSGGARAGAIIGTIENEIISIVAVQGQDHVVGPNAGVSENNAYDDLRMMGQSFQLAL